MYSWRNSGAASTVLWYSYAAHAVVFTNILKCIFTSIVAQRVAHAKLYSLGAENENNLQKLQWCAFLFYCNLGEIL